MLVLIGYGTWPQFSGALRHPVAVLERFKRLKDFSIRGRLQGAPNSKPLHFTVLYHTIPYHTLPYPNDLGQSFDLYIKHKAPWAIEAPCWATS